MTKPEAMIARERKNNCWPTRAQELLLKAALLSGQKANGAWREWKSSADIERVDTASFRLLPLLYANLRAERIQDPLMDKLKGVYRQVWYKNRLFFHHMAALLRSLHDAGIETLVLKGAPLVVSFYRNYGVRPMTDFDVLVPTRQASAAVHLLQSLGWLPADRWPETFHEAYVTVGNALGFKDAAGGQLDLHWHVLPECCRPDADDVFWAGAGAVEIDGVATQTLNAADHMLHVCAHGMKWDPVAPIRWVADAMTIMKSGVALDWDRLAAETEKRRLVWPLKEALRYLRETFDAPVPSRILDRIESIPASRRDLIEYRYKTENYETKALGYLPIHWFHYLRLEERARAKYDLLGFAKYLKRLGGLDNLGQLAARAAWKGGERLWKTLRRRSRRANAS
jgi:hypothetical protein